MSRHSTFDVKDIPKFKSAVNEELNPIIYLSIDPGKYNGVCGYDAKFYLQFMYVVNANDMIQFIHAFDKVEKCVIEDFKLYLNKAAAQKYSSMETSRIIGRVETWTEIKKIELIKQPARIKPTGYAWLGEKPPSKSSNKNDPMDAHVHFMYWAIKNGKVAPEKLLKRENI